MYVCVCIFIYLFKLRLPPYHSILIAKHWNRPMQQIKTNILSNYPLLQFICTPPYMFRLIKSRLPRYESIHEKTAD
jgi:hypothetical protein